MKKLFSLILAMLMLAMPLFSQAESVIGGADGPTEILVTNTLKLPSVLAEEALASGRRVITTLRFDNIEGVDAEDPMATAAILDLLNALGLTAAQQGDEFDMALTVSGKEVLTLGAAVMGDDAYIKSNLIGGTIVVGKLELEPLLNRLLDMLVLMEAMTEAEADELRTQITGLKETYGAAVEASMAGVFTKDDLKSLNLTALEQYAALMDSKVMPIEEIVVPRMCDPAVSGERVVLVNEDLVAGIKAVYQFLLDNPKLMNYIGSAAGYLTEEALELEWQTNGEFYMLFGMYEDEAAFLADHPSFAEDFAAAIAEIEQGKLIEGEFVTNVYYDAEDRIVYMTMDLPVFEQDATIVENEGQAVTGEVHPICVVYTRQTVAQGVAHVCNITVDGETMTVDTLVSETGMLINMTGLFAAGEAEQLAEIKVERGQSTADEGVELLTVDGTLYDEGKAMVRFHLDGASELSDVRTYLSGKLTLTSLAYGAQEPVAAEDAVQDTAAAPVETTVVLEFTTDTAINGVDFAGTTTFAVEAAGIRIGMAMDCATTDPESSIMAGDVIRPAELDDATFANWFVRVINSLNSWLSNVISSLPESVLTWMVYSGMF